MTTDKDGRYWRLLAPDASYTLKVFVDGQKGAEETITLTSDNLSVQFNPTLSFSVSGDPQVEVQPDLSILAYLALVGLILVLAATA